MPSKEVAKALQAETEALIILGLKRGQVMSLLQDPSRLTSARTPQSYLSKFETAINKYEASVQALIHLIEEENNNKAYKDKLTLQRPS